MKLFKTLIASAAVFACATTYAAAEQTKLIFSSWLPPTHGMSSMMYPELIKMIEEATDGKVTGEIKYGIAPPPAQMDLIQDGAIDVALIFHGYQPGRFTATKLIELPGYEGNAEDASKAYWQVYKDHLEKLDEHKGVKVIGLHTHGPGQIHSNKPIKTLADLDGLKTRLGGGVQSDVGNALGLIGIQVPAPKVYETLASGAADAVAMPLEGRKGFKLTEVAKNLYTMPGGLYRGSFAIIMSQEKFDSLPEDVQKALEEKVFGMPASAMAGGVWDKIDEIGLNATKEASDNTIVVASEEDQKAYAEKAKAIRAKVIKEIADKGVDAQAAYDQVAAELKKKAMMAQ